MSRVDPDNAGSLARCDSKAARAAGFGGRAAGRRGEADIQGRVPFAAGLARNGRPAVVPHQEGRSLFAKSSRRAERAVWRVRAQAAKYITLVE